MELAVCINTNSFPASSINLGKKLLLDAISGVLELHSGETSRVLFYYDSNNESLFDLEIAPDYSYEEFLNGCQDADLQLFLYEVEDKSPALNTLTEEQFDEIAEYDLYIPNQSLDSQRDIYALAWVLDGYLLSLAADERWQQAKIRANQIGEEGRYTDEFVSLRNISSLAHGQYHVQENSKVNYVELVKPHTISAELQDWIGRQTKENRRVIVNKLKLAIERDFQGGEPLFKPLVNSNSLREIRFSAYSGGAIRIFFRHHVDDQYALLAGYIKHSDNEGYDKYIPLAEQIYENLH